tara:strand:- start:2550 stop:3899 length:1350 start_codon:yes stop_codon:yes gene_type:complete
MIPNLDTILTEWSYRVGAIDYKNEKHLYHLNEILIEKGWPYTIIEELIQNLTEDDIVRNKKSGNTYVVKTHNKDTQDLIKKDASDDEIKKVKQDKDETNNTEYLKNLDIEVPEGLSDEEISSIVKTEKERRKFIGETVDILISQIGQQRGAGAYNVDRKDLQSLKSFAEGKGPKVENYSINQDDIDLAYSSIEEKVKNVEGVSLGKIRGMLQNKGAADPDSVRVGTSDNPGPGFGRRDKILESFLACGGKSAVTGRPVSIGGSNVDHRLSLGLGGKDEPKNWIWMETNLNMMKSSLSDDDLIKRVNKELEKSPEEERKKKFKQLLTKFTKKAYTEHYKKVFEKGGNGGFTEDDFKSMTQPQIKNIIRGWNAVYPKTSDFYVNTYKAQVGGSRADKSGKGGRGVALNKGDLIKNVVKQFSKKQPVLSSEEIKVMDDVLRKQIEKFEKENK